MRGAGWSGVEWGGVRWRTAYGVVPPLTHCVSSNVTQLYELIKLNYDLHRIKRLFSCTEVVYPISLTSKHVSCVGEMIQSLKLGNF